MGKVNIIPELSIKNVWNNKSMEASVFFKTDNIGKPWSETWEFRVTENDRMIQLKHIYAKKNLFFPNTVCLVTI